MALKINIIAIIKRESFFVQITAKQIKNPSEPNFQHSHPTLQKTNNKQNNFSFHKDKFKESAG